MTATVKVLNGEVSVGDTIAYSTRSGSSHDMVIAEVLAIGETQDPWSLPKPTLKVRAVTASDYKWRTKPNHTLTLTVLDRVVKLGAETSPELAEHIDWLKSFRVEFAGLLAATVAAGDNDVTYATVGALALLEMCLEHLATAESAVAA